MARTMMYPLRRRRSRSGWSLLDRALERPATRWFARPLPRNFPSRRRAEQYFSYPWPPIQKRRKLVPGLEMKPELIEVFIGFPPVLPTVFQSVRDNTPLEFELAKIHSFG